LGAPIIALGLSLPGPVTADDFGFSFECEFPVAEISVGEALYEFFTPLTSLGELTDSVDVTITMQVPVTWFGQFCQTSTGICYFADSRIKLTAGVEDTLRVDFFPDIVTPGHGGIILELQSVGDPSIRSYCAYTLYVGEAAPDVDLQAECPPETGKWVEGPFGLAEFRIPVTRAGLDGDSLVIRKDASQLAGDWFTQICLTSNGICYSDDLITFHFPPGFEDTLRVDIITGENPGYGEMEVLIHSQAVPSLIRKCVFAAYDGDAPSATPEPALPGGPRLRVQPNPVRGTAEIVFGMEAAGMVRADVFGPDGRLVRRLDRAEETAGVKTIAWDGRDEAGRRLPTGVYLVRVSTPEGASGAKVLLAR
jgi:hypothetical protein